MKNETITLTQQEFFALDQMRGLSGPMHFFVKSAQPTLDGCWTLEAAPDLIGSLRQSLSKEIEEELGPSTDRRHLWNVYSRLSGNA